MRYGFFSEDNREYIITRPDTPSPWINYISNPSGYCGIISQTAGGFSFYKDPRDRRITKYRYNNVPVDRPGRYIYIKDMESGEYWSPTWQPVMKKYEKFECRHGLGYTVIKSTVNSIENEVLYFVPEGYSCEIWKLRIKNNGKTVKQLSIVPYSEFTLWSEPESRNIQWSLHLTRCSFENEMVVYKFIEPHPEFNMNGNADYIGDRPGFAFMGTNAQIKDFDCVRDRFIGLYRSESNPIGVENSVLSNSILRGGIACAALRTEISLNPGEEKELIIVLGFAETIHEADTIKGKFTNSINVMEALDKVKSSWENYLENLTVESPDSELNTLVNVWNQYQCKTTFDWSRYISFYENGESRGMGTRDSCQDILAVNSHIPKQIKKRILQILSTTQFETGDCYHQFFPSGGKGELKGFSDDHLWLIQMVFAYITETGDINLLNEKCGFADSGKTATVYEHIVKAVNYTREKKGPNGLPLILTADWNDTLHLWMESRNPESVFTAALYVYALKLMAQLAKNIGKEYDAKEFLKRADRMSKIVNEICWDGEWYLRGFGSKTIGTAKSDYAKIFLNPQSWAVISGIADMKRAKICMNSVKKYLTSEYGVKLIWPPFKQYNQTFGLISRYNTGRKENGIFVHANAWAIIAESILERQNNAYEYYRNVLPLKRNDSAEFYKTEPYVFCQTITTEDAYNVNEGANSWLTGTASWMYIAATQYILGIRPILEGLMIKPCVPTEWKGYKVKRKFRNCDYYINFKKTGKFKLTIEGKDISGNIIPAQNLKRVEVAVEY